MSTVGIFGKAFPEDNIIGSPLKKARPSISDINDIKPGMFPPALGDILAKAEAAQAAKNQSQSAPVTSTPLSNTPLSREMEEEEEL